MTILVYVLWYVFAGFPLWKILEMELLLDDVLLCESTASNANFPPLLLS